MTTSAERKAIKNLAQAVEESNRDFPLPRCSHGSALKDHGGENLEPPCGCRFPKVPRPVPLAMFGQDHWSTFGYVECRCVDNKGIPEKRHMRCDSNRHPAHGHTTWPHDYPTLLRGDISLPLHDDWDCVDDLEAAGLITVAGTGLYPVLAMTAKGQEIAALLRQHKASGGSFGTFVLEANLKEKK